MKYNFDEIIDRRNTNSLNVEGFKQYIFGADGFMTFQYEDDEFIRMWVADMDFAVPQVILDGIKQRLDRRIFGYTKIFNPAYFEAFNSWCERRYQWKYNKSHLVTSNGIIPALFELIEYICESDEKVIFFTPSYAYFKHAADHNNIRYVCSGLKNNGGYYEIDFHDFEAKASDPQTTLCIFCNPHNPSGRVWTEDELKRFGDICIENNLWIISDDIHCDLLRVGGKYTPMSKLFPQYNKLITCLAPSKTFNLAGLMFSNIIIPDDKLRQIWLERHYGMENPLSIAAAQTAYSEGDDWLDAMRNYLDENFKYLEQFLTKYLRKAVFRIPEATYLAWIDVKDYFDKEENLILFFANNAGVLLEDSSMFVNNSDRCIRLNLACPRAVLKEGLNRIYEAIQKNIMNV